MFRVMRRMRGIKTRRLRHVRPWPMLDVSRVGTPVVTCVIDEYSGQLFGIVSTFEDSRVAVNKALLQRTARKESHQQMSAQPVVDIH